MSDDQPIGQQPEPSPYVLAWRLDGQKVVVVGGGSIGTAKVELLLATGARLTVVDPTPSPRVRELADTARLRLKTRKARPTDLLGARLLVAATGCAETNRRCRRWARPLGVVVNAVDDPDNCDVTVPAIIRRGPVAVAITTGGGSPAGARFLRERLTKVVDDALPARLDEVFTHAAGARRQLKHSGHYRYDYPVWRERFFEPAMDMLAEADGSARYGHHASQQRDGDPSRSLDAMARNFVAGFETNMEHRPGKVLLVGAGPGGVDLITVRGARALAAADVVVYDRLADPALVDLAPPAAQRLPVGKGKGFGMDQVDINRLLVDHAAAGDTVVRLKGGDPFVFGRGREELDAVIAAGYPVEVIPGVSSVVGGPGLAGIPLTDRRVAASFTVVTGHRAIDEADEVASRARWTAIAAGSDTVVVLMAASTASATATHLLAGGRSSREPVAFIHAAGTPDEQTSFHDLQAVARNGCPFPAPTLMVVGSVAQATTAPLAPDAQKPCEPLVSLGYGEPHLA